MESIILARNIDINAITYGKPKALDSGGRMVYVGYKGRPLIIQTPVMRAPFGVTKWSSDKGPDKYSLELSFRGMKSRRKLMAFYDKLLELDKKLVQDALDNSTQWLRKKYTTTEVFEALYAPLIKHTKDKETGEITDKYPPTFRVGLPQNEHGIACEVYNEQQQLVDINDIETKGAQITAIIQCSGIWIAAPKFGCSWKVVQLRITPPSQISGFAFMSLEGNDNNSDGDIDIDDDSYNPKPTHYVDDSDDEVIPQKRVRRVVRKKKPTEDNVEENAIDNVESSDIDA